MFLDNAARMRTRSEPLKLSCYGRFTDRGTVVLQAVCKKDSTEAGIIRWKRTTKVSIRQSNAAQLREIPKSQGNRQGLHE